MRLLKTIWGLLFRLFACPTAVGLYRIGNPERESPVLLTCNFHLTVERLKRVLRGIDAWLLVADSKGVNVWCAAGGDEFNTQSVVSALKTSEIGHLVDHHTVILPPLGGPGIRAVEVQRQTGWSVRWGPVRMKDLPHFLEGQMGRNERMKRVTFDWRERLDAGLGSLFIPYVLGAVGFAVFGGHLLLHYLFVGAVAFLIFMLICPWIPGERGVTKALFLSAPLAVVLSATWLVPGLAVDRIQAALVIGMVMFAVCGFELGGVASTMPSELDPLLARVGVGKVGIFAFAGCVRTDLLNGTRRLTSDRATCTGCRRCVEICPQGVWEIDEEKHAVLARAEDCTACRACLVQCETGAIRADPVGSQQERAVFNNDDLGEPGLFTRKGR
jgi:NAD-dependent dihydropyrimidine dehydrogenase PreA subunit